MAKIVGDVEVMLDGVTYTLHMGMREIAALQEQFGDELTPFLVPPKAGGLPKFGAYLRMVELALCRYHKDAAPIVAEDILAANLTIVPQLLAAAFPDAKLPVPGARPGKRTATVQA